MYRYRILILAALFLAACKKEGAIISSTTRISGTWVSLYALDPDNGKQVDSLHGPILTIFRPNGTYSVVRNGDTTVRGIYSINKTISNFTGQMEDGISFDQSKDLKLISVQHDTLRLTDNYPHGIGYFYKQQ